MVAGGQNRNGFGQEPIAERRAETDAAGDIGQPKKEVVARILANGHRGIEPLASQSAQDP
jgi:hypothetical protein